MTHEVETLDAEGVGRALGRWPPAPAEGDAEGEDQEPALLVALHACGDLTPDALKAFLAADTTPHPRRRKKGGRGIFVGCCYNMQTPSLFPLSSTVSSLLSSQPSLSSLPTHPMNRAHLRLTPQSPPTWHLTPSSSSSFAASTLKIAFRARFEAELEASAIGVNDERRVGRIPEMKTWKEYRVKALERYDYGETLITEVECPPREFEGGEEGWEEALWKLRVFWTLRSWLGPSLETLCVVDRFAYRAFLPFPFLSFPLGADGGWRRRDETRLTLSSFSSRLPLSTSSPPSLLFNSTTTTTLTVCEGLSSSLAATADGEEPTRRVEVVNVFEQATGSLRNLALVVR